jgi:hypothetical protein
MPTPKFLLEVESSVLSRALKELSRAEKRNTTLQLSFSSGQLSIAAGQSSTWVPAAGSWPKAVVVSRSWGEALAKRPFKVAVLTLTVSEGKLHARDYVVACQFEDYSDEDRFFRRGNVVRAVQVLNHYGVTEQELEDLIDSGDSKGFEWAAGDAGVIKEVAETWKHLVYHGVAPRQIRALIDSKTRKLISDRRHERSTSPPQFEDYSDEDRFFRRGNVVKAVQVLKHYGVTEQELQDLINSGHSKGFRWAAVDPTLIKEVAETWKHLAYHGVEPHQIKVLIESKMRKLISDSRDKKSPPDKR